MTLVFASGSVEDMTSRRPEIAIAPGFGIPSSVGY